MLEFLPWSRSVFQDCYYKYTKNGRLCILDVELGGACNFACHICDTPKYMQDIGYSLNEIERLIIQGDIQWLFLCGLGEPTAGKNRLHFKHLLSFCRDHKVKCSVFTNLSLFDDEMFQFVQDGTLYPLFKLDSLNPEVSSKIYEVDVGVAKQQLLNAHRLIECIKIEDNSTNVCASIVPSADNKDELFQLVNWCYDNNIFPLIGDLENAGKGQEQYEKLKLKDDELIPLKKYIYDIQGIDYQIPICPSVLFGLHINYEGYVVVDGKSGLSCHWFWLTEPSIQKLQNINNFSFNELSRIVIDNREKYKEKLNIIAKDRSRLVFGGCGGDIVDLLKFYLEKM